MTEEMAHELAAIRYEPPRPGVDAMGRSAFVDIAEMQCRLESYAVSLAVGEVSEEKRGKDALWGRLASRAAINARVDLKDPKIQARLREERERLRYRDWR